MTELWDLFICHASEDKDSVARPLAEALQKKDFRVWYDEYTLKMGDSLRRTIDRGLQESRYGIVVLSKNFFAKTWPQKELDGLDAREVHGKKVILPVWHDITKDDVLRYSPRLADRLAAETKGGIGHVVDMVIDAIGQKKSQTIQDTDERKDKIIRIEAEKELFIIGKSISFRGISENSGNQIRIIIYGPGEFSRGKEVATTSIDRHGAWKFQWTTDCSILPGWYTVTAYDSELSTSDEVLVSAIKGAVTIVAGGKESYYIGDKIKCSGICTAGSKVFLFLKGPNAIQEERKLDQLAVFAQNNVSETFVRVDVMSDNTWSYIWDSSVFATLLKQGFYRIYAVESPVTSDNLSNKAHEFVMIHIKNPFVSATISSASIARGDRLFIKGTAEGSRNHELQIWIFGDSLIYPDKIFTNIDASFSYEIPPIFTKKLIPGSYFTVIQHPMMNNEFDIYFDEGKHYVRFKFPPHKGDILFTTDGAILKGFEALGALIQALEDKKIDDTYVVVTFTIESPFIKFDPIGDRHQGDKFSIVATTNLSVNDEIFIEFFSSKYDQDLIKKIQLSPPYSGFVTVVKGDAALNKISFDIDASSLEPDEYIVKGSAMDLDVSASSLFNVIE